MSSLAASLVASVVATPTVWRAGAGHVTFDSARGAVTAMETVGSAEGPGSATVPGQAQRLFGVKLWAHHGAPRSAMVDPEGWALDARASATPTRFAFKHTAAGLTARLHANETADSLLLTLELRATRAGGVTLAEVAFPQLGGVRSTGAGQKNGRESELVSGGGVRGTGLRIADPARNLSSPRLQWYKYKGVASPGVTQDPYPHAGTNWVALADPTAALYLGTHDPNL